MSRSIVLIGFSGAGKSTVGRLLASRLNMPFVDSDKEIERLAKCPVPEIFARGGEAAFRSLEGQVLRDALSGAPAVIAAGGGSLEAPGVPDLLQEAQVVYLEIDHEEALRRIAGMAKPMLDRYDPAQLHAERRRAYRDAAAICIDASGEPDAVATAVAEALGGHPG